MNKGLEDICKNYVSLSKEERLSYKRDCYKLFDKMTFNQRYDIGFLDMQKCKLHFFKFSEKSDIYDFMKNQNMAIIFVK